MHIHGELEIIEGNPYRAIMALESSTDDGVTDIWVRVTPNFTGSDELYKLTMESTDLSVAHYATTLSATVLLVTVKEKQFGSPRGEEGRVILARSAVHSLLATLNGIENNVWPDV